MTSKQPLPVAAIPQAELSVVRRAWVSTGFGDGNVPTASDAVGLLTSDGPALAVIAGPDGYGKRTAGIRALWEVSLTERVAAGSEPFILSEIRPDWDKAETPDVSLLPERPGTGYLLDIATEIGGWNRPDRVAAAVVTHAEHLRLIGSYLVVIADDHGWPEELSGTLARVVVRAKNRPSAYRVAAAHLEYLHHKPERIRWLNPASSGSGSGMVGGAAHLLTDTSAPADAARLAAALARTDDSEVGLKRALAAFQEWRTQVTDVFKATEKKPADRALLIATLFLGGEEALTIQKAAGTLLGKDPEDDVEVILTGPDLSARLRGVGAEVTGRHATLDHQPGYAQAVLNHLWRQRPDIHPHLLKWLDAITASGQPGVPRLGAISDLLVELAIVENDIKVIEQVRTWIDSGNSSTEHLQLIAGVFAKAAESDALGPKVRSRLLDWAQEQSTSVTTVVALVCQSEFADHYPRQSLVRLRHVLDRAEEDTAVRAAEEALQSIAARTGQLPRVWATVIKWATEHGHLAGHRAFLSLLDPQQNPYVLQVMMAAAEEKPDIRQALIRGWNAALADSRVAAQCRDLMIAWAHARADGLVPPGLITDLLRQVVLEHMYSSPVSAFVFGEPGVQYDEPVIALRKDLQLPILAPTQSAGDEALES
ncbi:hypothetical protein ACIBI4_13915 [Streptomyces sp. NPDC050418]|uniref:hypothetical protein n=1 Tax=Streptomyces sp. NPDC050418 TaxID=3365612 RepID=UPI003799D4D8